MDIITKKIHFNLIILFIKFERQITFQCRNEYFEAEDRRTMIVLVKIDPFSPLHKHYKQLILKTVNIPQTIIEDTAVGNGSVYYMHEES